MLEWIVSSSVLAALMIVLRYLLRGHISLRLQYSIWLILLLRLLLPVSLGTSPVSVANALPQAAEFNYVQTNQSQGDDSSVYITPPQLDSDTSVPAQQPFDWAGLAMKLWAAGALVLLLWFAAINLSLWKKLCRSRRRLSVPDYPLSVYITNNIEAPCLFGLFRPCVYLTPETAVDGPALRHVLEHERAHWRHGDHIWALMRGLCLALHWYNPLVWWAAVLSGRDAELACDEAALKRLGEEQRGSYGRTLLSITCGRRPELMRAAATMTGGKRGIYERILMLARRPRTAVLTLALVILAAVFFTGCTFTGAEGPDWREQYLAFWDSWDIKDSLEHQGFQLIDLDFNGTPELIAWFAGGPVTMASQVFGLVDGQAQNLGGNFGVLVKGELGAEGDGFGNPWPQPSYWLLRSRETGEYCWCVYSMTADEEETQCVLLMFRGLDKESFDSCSDEAGETHGRARIWRQLNKEYEVIPVDSRPFTLSVFDGDDLSNESLAALMEAWEPIDVEGLGA